VSAPALSGRCAECGARMSRSWLRDGLELSPWLDDRGRPTGGESERDRLYALLDVLDERPELRSETSVMAAYSRLNASVLLSFGDGGDHLHRVEVEPFSGVVPECCGWPMRLVRDGWACRYPSFDHQRIAA
jgi:hypothetical protein